MPSSLIIAALLLSIASSIGGYTFGHSVATDHYESVINALKNEATVKLAEKTKEALEATEKQIQTAQELDKVNHETNQKINTALAANRSTKLRYRSTAGSCRTVSKSGPTVGTATSSNSNEFELPEKIARDLFELAADADKVNNYADTCSNWVRSLR